MKRFAYLMLALVLTASVFTGCGCTNRNAGTITEPSVLPTNEEVWESTVPTTHATRPTTAPTHPTENYDHGNGPLETTTDPTESTAAARSGRSGMMPNIR